MDHDPILITGWRGAWSWCRCGWTTFSTMRTLTEERAAEHMRGAT